MEVWFLLSSLPVIYNTTTYLYYPIVIHAVFTVLGKVVMINSNILFYLHLSNELLLTRATNDLISNAKEYILILTFLVCNVAFCPCEQLSPPETLFSLLFIKIISFTCPPAYLISLGLPVGHFASVRGCYSPDFCLGPFIILCPLTEIVDE